MEGSLFNRARMRLACLVIASAAPAAAMIAPGTASAASTLTIAPNTANTTNTFPFGRGNNWTPFLGFAYKNLPAFALKTNDVLAFDLCCTNDAIIQLKLEMATTSVNGGNEPGGAYTTIASNTQIPENPLGNNVNGDFELRFRAEAPFSFPGGGLIIRASNPGAALAADVTDTLTLTNGGDSSDSTGYFAGRFWGDGDGLPPYGSSGLTQIAAFRLEIADLPPTPAAPLNKKCKKKKSAKSAKKKRCKKPKKK